MRYRVLAGPVRYQLRLRFRTARAFCELHDFDGPQLSRVLNERVPLTWEYGHRLAVALGIPDDVVMEPVLPAEMAERVPA